MLAQDKLGILSTARQGLLYIDRDVVFALRPGSPPQLLRCGLLSAWAKSLASQIGRRSTIVEATDFANNITRFMFCVGTLIPYLRYINSGQDAPEWSARLRSELAHLQKRSGALRTGLARWAGPPVRIDALQRIFNTPCAITLGIVMPLKVVPLNLTQEPHDITLNRTRYRPCLDKARQLSTVLSDVEFAIRRWQESTDPTAAPVRDEAARLLDVAKDILDMLGTTDTERYKIIYRDQNHQLHHNHGHFVLIRGPLPLKDGTGRFFVGLNILGAIKDQCLATPPRVAKSIEEFWTADGLPATGGMCMGDKKQYARLCMPILKNEEALVQWLDAGVLLATRTPAFHDKWRKQRGLTRQVHRVPGRRRL